MIVPFPHDPTNEKYLGCLDFYKYWEWSNELEEAYRSRATLNEWSIYFAGTIALAALSTVAGIAAVGEATSQTAALIPISGGFVSAFFALLDNKARAAFYTEAANAINEAREEAYTSIRANQDYRTAADELYKRVSKAIRDLETTRKTAASADQRLTREIEKLRREFEALKTAEAAKLGSTKSIDPGSIKAGQSAKVTLTVNFDLSDLDSRDLMVLMGQTEVPVEAKGKNYVVFEPPPQRPIDTIDVYPVLLRAGNTLFKSTTLLRYENGS